MTSIKDEKTTGKKLKQPNKHGNYFQGIEITCICDAKFTINTTVSGPMRVETCYKCHPAYNKDKEIKQVIKGRMEKFLEKQNRMEKLKSSK